MPSLNTASSCILLTFSTLVIGTTMAQNSWQIQTTPTSPSDNAWINVVFGDGKFVAISNGGTAGNQAMTSSDGVTWTLQAGLPVGVWYGLTWGGSQFVATAIHCDTASKLTDNCIATSPDGITWTPRVAPSDGWWMHVGYGEPSGNGLYVAMGFKYCSGSCAGGNQQIITSSDGITWTHRAAPVNAGWLGVTWGNGKFVATCKGNVDATSTSTPGNRVATSTDGITWSSETTPSDNSWNNVVYGNNLFVAVADSGTGDRVMTSADGVTWTLRSAPDKPWWTIIYANSLFVAVGGFGGSVVMTSSDGITWAEKTAAADNQWYGIAYGNDVWVAVSTTGTGNRAMSSSASGASPSDSSSSSSSSNPHDVAIGVSVAALVLAICGCVILFIFLALKNKSVAFKVDGTVIVVGLQIHVGSMLISDEAEAAFKAAVSEASGKFCGESGDSVCKPTDVIIGTVCESEGHVQISYSVPVFYEKADAASASTALENSISSGGFLANLKSTGYETVTDIRTSVAPHVQDVSDASSQEQADKKPHRETELTDVTTGVELQKVTCKSADTEKAA